jgi:hypothetical protein
MFHFLYLVVLVAQHPQWLIRLHRQRLHAECVARTTRSKFIPSCEPALQTCDTSLEVFHKPELQAATRQVRQSKCIATAVIGWKRCLQRDSMRTPYVP